MNKSKIEWCDHTWNPITGCNHGCHYCYARTMTARFSGDIRLNKMCKADYSTQTGPDGSTLYVLEAYAKRDRTSASISIRIRADLSQISHGYDQQTENG